MSPCNHLPYSLPFSSQALFKRCSAYHRGGTAWILPVREGVRDTEKIDNRTDNCVDLTEAPGEMKGNLPAHLSRNEPEFALAAIQFRMAGTKAVRRNGRRGFMCVTGSRPQMGLTCWRWLRWLRWATWFFGPVIGSLARFDDRPFASSHAPHAPSLGSSRRGQLVFPS